jgi:CDP-glucose 4,6-dehydratase
MPNGLLSIYREKTVFVTGHTGFKGSWLCLWLNLLGANVVGYSLHPPSNPNHYDLVKPNVTSTTGDILNFKKLQEAIRACNPDIVFHLAAQPLVRDSYEHPVETFETNVMGTVHVLEACVKLTSVKAVIIVSSDKCYKNQEGIRGYREDDPMGGYDPYSASKGCSELVTASYRDSFFNVKDYGKAHHVLIASARAGNVIGGGDWAKDRLVPDIMKATQSGKKVIVRNPHATRPWQHVLEPLSGYLFLGQRLLEGKKEFAQSWNFGPDTESDLSVGNVVAQLKETWTHIEFELRPDVGNLYEAALLNLDCSKANSILKWKPVWNLQKTLEKTAGWYKTFFEKNELLSQAHLNEYIHEATKNKIEWTSPQR